MENYNKQRKSSLVNQDTKWKIKDDRLVKVPRAKVQRGGTGMWLVAM